ncbi:MAG: hypothetical protein OEX22_08975, partial [Cyclobacteriaceae bacterium]|nr:hypothetical protein [Cyclobacteriaceae bacterium]
SPPEKFSIVPLAEGALKGASYAEINQFREMYQVFQQDLSATSSVLSESMLSVGAMKRAMDKSENVSDDLFNKLYQVRLMLLSIEKELKGDPTKGEIGERSNPTPGDGGFIGWTASQATYGPTATHKAALNRAQKQLTGIKAKLKALVENEIPSIENELKANGAPWIEGQGLIED